MPLINVVQGSEEWKAARKGLVTSSVAAAALGLSEHDGPKKAWRMILGTEPEQDNEYIRWGNKFEQRAVEEYTVQTGHLCYQTGFWLHPLLPWLGASPDRLIGKDGMAEIKCPRRLPKSLPLHHRIQILIELACTGRVWCDYFAWTVKEQFTCRVDASHPAEALYTLELIQKLGEWYRAYVVTGIEPPAKQRKRKKTVHTEVLTEPSDYDWYEDDSRPGGD